MSATIEMPKLAGLPVTQHPEVVRHRFRLRWESSTRFNLPTNDWLLVHQRKG